MRIGMGTEHLRGAVAVRIEIDSNSQATVVRALSLEDSRRIVRSVLCAFAPLREFFSQRRLSNHTQRRQDAKGCNRWNARPTDRKGSRRILRPVLGRFGSRMTIPAVVAALNRRLNSGIPSGMLLNPLNCQPSILIGAGGDGDRAPARCGRGENQD